MPRVKPLTERDFWPCLPVDEDGVLRSIIFTKFELLSRTHPRATSGYAIETLIKKLASPALRKRVKFDPEADMFAAYGDDPAALLDIAKLLRTATGMRPPRVTAAKATRLVPDAAREALRRGFIEGLDADAQRAFLAGWPRPADSNHDRLLKELRAKDAKLRLTAARQILRAACRVVGRIEDPLCHPTTFDGLVAAIAAERDAKIYDVLVPALAMLVRRALPDLRTAAVFTPLLDHARARVREAAVVGLGHLAAVPWPRILAFLDAKRPEMRIGVCHVISHAAHPMTPWITGDLELTRAPFPRAELPRVARLLDDPDPHVRVAAAHAVRDLGAKELAPELARRAKREKVAWVRQSLAYDANALRGKRT